MSEKEGSTELAGGELGTVNASGFPLQLALMHAVKEVSATGMDYSVLYAEHAWKSIETGEAGFIDLVVDKMGRVRFVIECKRVQDSAWYFLSADGKADRSAYSTLMRTEVTNHKEFVVRGLYEEKEVICSAWGSFRTGPECSDALFCVVRGGSEASLSRQPLVERVAGELCTAVEALAESQEPAFRANAPSMGKMFFAFYVPVIVTTATLKVVNVDPASISLKTGKIEQGKVEAKEVPFVKMTKQLSVHVQTSEINPGHGKRYIQARERTVYIVNAECFIDFMRAFNIDSMGGRWPLA